MKSGLVDNVGQLRTSILSVSLDNLYLAYSWPHNDASSDDDTFASSGARRRCEQFPGQRYETANTVLINNHQSTA